MARSCTKCTTKDEVPVVQGSSFLSTFLIIIIPKCPFCVLAFSSAISVCGGEMVYMNSNNWASYIPMALSAFTIAMVLLNKNGKRTTASILVAFIGTAMIVGAIELILDSAYYTLGSVLLIMAVWLNGSFLSLISFLKNRVEHLYIQWRK